MTYIFHDPSYDLRKPEGGRRHGIGLDLSVKEVKQAVVMLPGKYLHYLSKDNLIPAAGFEIFRDLSHGKL